MIHLLPSLAFGVVEGLLVVGVVMLMFGARKIPEIARGMGSGIRNFKGELKEPEGEGDGASEGDGAYDDRR